MAIDLDERRRKNDPARRDCRASERAAAQPACAPVTRNKLKPSTVLSCDRERPAMPPLIDRNAGVPGAFAMHVEQPAGTSSDEKPTPEQLAELRRLSREARVSDWSEVVQSREEAAMRIEDLKVKARIE
jgi:hypothetical protein